jgi:PAS domain S-box-containing protein
MTAELLSTAHAHARSTPFDGAHAEKFLDGLGRLYRFVLITDQSRKIRWMSQEFSELCDPAEPSAAGADLETLMGRVTKRAQALALRAQLRERGYLAGSRLEISGPSGAPLSLELSVLPLSDRPDEAGFLAVIARPELAREPVLASLPRASGIAAVLLAGLPDAVLVIDGQGLVRYANRAVERLLGRKPAELMGRPAALLCSRARDLDAVLRALDAGDDAALDLTLRRGDGDAVAVSATASPVPPEADLSRGMILTLRDATPSRGALAELQRKNEDLEQCVNTLAHDLRSPLVALLGFSRLLRQDYGARLDDTGLHFVDRIEQAGRTMESLIHDLLELSRIGQPGERRSMVDPRAVLQQLHAELKPRLEAGGIELKLPAHPPLVYCDRTRLYQVFSNLIGNAIEHMGPCQEACIAVDVVQEADCEHITVRDPGRGIAPEHHERIFEVFQSLGRHNDESRGTGIGLAIVRRIAQTHGGRAWVESRPGHGSTFHVTLPRR